MKRARTLLSAALMAVTALGLSVTTVDAEQIQLSNGRFIQGDIVDSDDAGFTFKLTASGGEVYLRWSQIHQDDRDRIQNVQDPDGDLQDVYVVRTTGDRIELLSGDVYEGDITYSEGKYSVTNQRYRNLVVEEDEVIEGGFKEDVEIDAAAVLEPAEILALKEEQTPPETGQDYYELARLAEHLGLYKEAKGYIEETLAAPDANSNLVEVAQGWDATLDELIRNEKLLEVATLAREQAGDNLYQPALDGIRELMEGAELSGKIKETMEETYNAIDVEFTQFVVDEWFDHARKLISKHCRKDYSEFSEALSFVRGQLDQLIMATIAAEVGNDDYPADEQDIYQRFLSRLEGLQDDQDALEDVRTRSADFGKKGWYQLVGGNIPNGGNEKQPNNGNNNNGNGNGNFPPGFPRGRDRDGIEDGDDANQSSDDQAPFQGRRSGGDGSDDGDSGLPGGIDPADIVGEIVKRMGGSDSGGNGIDDLTKPEMPEPPENCPPITEWWEEESWSRRKRWLMAYYVYTAAQRGSVLVVEEKKLSHRFEYY